MTEQVIFIGAAVFVVLGLIAWLTASILWEMHAMTASLAIALLVICVLGVGGITIAVNRLVDDTQAQVIEYVNDAIASLEPTVPPDSFSPPG